MKEVRKEKKPGKKNRSPRKKVRKGKKEITAERRIETMSNKNDQDCMK